MQSQNQEKNCEQTYKEKLLFTQFIRLFVSTQTGLQFIVCVDRNAKKLDLETQISDTFEYIEDPDAIYKSDDVQIRTYKVTNIRHLGYQVVIPRHLTIGHLLEDKAQITCDITRNVYSQVINAKQEELANKKNKKSEKNVLKENNNVIEQEHSINEEINKKPKLNQSREKIRLSDDSIDHDLKSFLKEKPIEPQPQQTLQLPSQEQPEVVSEQKVIKKQFQKVQKQKQSVKHQEIVNEAKEKVDQSSSEELPLPVIQKEKPKKQAQKKKQQPLQKTVIDYSANLFSDLSC